VSVLGRLQQLVPGLYPKLGQIIVVLGCVTSCYVLQALFTARVLSGVLAGQGARELSLWIVGILALIALRAGLLFVRGRVALQVSGAATAALRRALASKLLELGPGWANRQRSGELQSLLVDGVESVEPFVARFIPQCVVTTLGALALAGYMMRVDWVVGGVVALCSLAAPFVPIVSWRYIKGPTERWQVHYRALYADNLDAIQGMSTLKMLGASRRRGETLAHSAREFCRTSTKVILIWGPYVGVVALLVASGSALAVGVGALHRANGVLTSGELLSILLLARECFRPVKDLEHAYHESLAFLAYAKAMFGLLDTASPVINGSVHLRHARPSLTFDHVSFRYDSQERPALDDFTCQIAAEQRVAIVGRSGAGKTTLISLLLRLFDPQHGTIRLGDRDIRDLSITALHDMIGLVSQDTYLFHGTVRDNLRIARPDASQAQLEAATRAAHVHTLIERLPRGYDTTLGERGLTLSGGERQRLAIARALLKDAPILVLDEATSHLDAKNEASIQQAIEQVSAGRLTLVIAHRLSTVKHVDRVVLLERGRIVEQGTHAELIARAGAYSQLVAAQTVSPTSAVSALVEVSA